MKKYPPHPEKIHDFCECGHLEIQHDEDMFGRLRRCVWCTCPKFAKEVTMTITEYKIWREQQKVKNVE